MAIFCSYVGLDLQLYLVGRGGGFEGLCSLHQLSDSCYEMKKYEKRFPYILVEEHYFISLQ